MTPRRFAWPSIMIAVVLTTAHAVSAQTYTGDARKVALGGSIDDADIAAGMVPSAERSTVIQVPIGLIQLIKTIPAFNPTSTAFDPIRAIESAAGPLHYTSGRTDGGPAATFVTGLVNGDLNRDLSTYRGFRLPQTLSAAGLASPVAGKTIKLVRSKSGGFQGLFVGAGPYVSFNTTLGVDPRLTEILAGDVPVVDRNTTLQTENRSAVQVAMAITFGYRAHFALAGDSAGNSGRDGVYVALNYRHLKGFRYLQPSLRVRFDTDAAGMISTQPQASALVVDDVEATSGHGRAIDVGVDVVRGRWQAGIGVNGIANRIGWTNFTSKRIELATLVEGLDFAERPLAAPFGGLTVKLPVVSGGHASYEAGPWLVRTGVTKGYNGTSFSSGLERRLGPLELRGGGRYARHHWDPTGGVGIGRKVALDVGFYGTRANVEGARRMAMAVSIRINHGR